MLRNQKNWKLDSSDFRQIASLLMLIKQKNLSLPGSLTQVKSVINSRLDMLPSTSNKANLFAESCPLRYLVSDT